MDFPEESTFSYAQFKASNYFGPNVTSWIDNNMKTYKDEKFFARRETRHIEFTNVEFKQACAFADLHKVDGQQIQLENNKFKLPFIVARIHYTGSWFVVDIHAKTIIEMELLVGDMIIQHKVGRVERSNNIGPWIETEIIAAPNNQTRKVTFPDTLVRLRILDDRPVDALKLPPSLKRLEFANPFNQYIDGLNFEDLVNLTELQFGDVGCFYQVKSLFDKPNYCLKRLPQKLTYFRFMVVADEIIRTMINTCLMVKGKSVEMHPSTYNRWEKYTYCL